VLTKKLALLLTVNALMLITAGWLSFQCRYDFRQKYAITMIMFSAAYWKITFCLGECKRSTLKNTKYTRNGEWRSIHTGITSSSTSH